MNFLFSPVFLKSACGVNYKAASENNFNKYIALSLIQIFILVNEDLSYYCMLRRCYNFL